MTNSSLLNVSGNGKLGYSGTTGINYDELLKNYPTSGTLHEVYFYFNLKKISFFFLNDCIK